jgi:rhodanese-related sulfurtransferase
VRSRECLGHVVEETDQVVCLRLEDGPSELPDDRRDEASHPVDGHEERHDPVATRKLGDAHHVEYEQSTSAPEGGFDLALDPLEVVRAVERLVEEHLQSDPRARLVGGSHETLTIALATGQVKAPRLAWTAAGFAHIMCAVATVPRRTLEELLDEASGRIERLHPAEAFAAAERGAVLIDIRSDAARERDGIVPGSLHIPRTVLEWRLDPESDWRNPHVGALDGQVVLICDHGCSSVLAAATAVQLGFTRAGDVVGGFAAWLEAGLPTVPAPPPRADGEPPGLSAPDS